jgi:transcriptional regulator with XRE-family HTH domain
MVNASKALEKITGEKFSFSMAIRAYRTREDLTQQELADLVGVKKSYISNIENKRDFVSIEQAAKFARAFKEPVDLWMTWAIQDQINRAGEKFKIKLVA